MERHLVFMDWYCIVNIVCKHCKAGIPLQRDLHVPEVPIESPVAFCSEMEKLILKFIWNFKRLQVTKRNLKRNKVGRVTFLSFKTYYKATDTKTAWYWHKDRHTDKQNKIDSPEINLYIYG